MFTGHRITVFSLSFGPQRKPVCCLSVPILPDEKFAIVWIGVLLLKMHHFSLDIFTFFLFIFGYQQFNYVGFLCVYAPWGSLRHLNPYIWDLSVTLVNLGPLLFFSSIVSVAISSGSPVAHDSVPQVPEILFIFPRTTCPSFFLSLLHIRSFLSSRSWTLSSGISILLGSLSNEFVHFGYSIFQF